MITMRQATTKLIPLCMIGRVSVALAFGLGFGACKDDDVDAIQGQAAAYLDELEAQSSVVCECHDELGYSDRSQCESDAELGPSVRRCMTDAFAADPTASRTYFDCILPLEREFTACIDGRLRCSEILESVDGCAEDYDVGFERCIDLPESVERALDGCEGNE